MQTLERQELYCHECGGYVQFDVDVSLDGNHVLLCPKCGHEHCRVVKDGKITDIRWDRRNRNKISVSNTTVTWSSASTWQTYNTKYTTATNRPGTSAFLYNSWLNITTN